MYQKKSLLCILVICICAVWMFSCTGDNQSIHENIDTSMKTDVFPTTEALPTYSETVYNFHKIANENGVGLTLWAQSTLGDELWMLFWADGQMVFHVYDENGVLTRTVSVPDTIMSNYVIPYDKETFLYADILDMYNMQFVLCTHDGETIGTSGKIRNIDYSSGVVLTTPQLRRVGDGICYFYEFDMYVFPDGDITKEPLEIELPCRVRTVDVLSDGTWLLNGFLLSSSENLYYTLDPKTGACTEYRYSDTVEQPEMLFSSARSTYYQNNAFYGVCTDGLYVFRDEKTEKLIDWVQSNLDQSALELLYVLSDTCYVVEYYNVMSKISDVCILKQAEELRTKPREIISLASIGLAGEYRQLINSAVIQFNRENEDYKVLYHDYNLTERQALRSANVILTETEEERAAAQRQFEEDLLSGVVYDCYLFPEQSKNRDLLADKGLLADLSPYLSENQVMGCIETAYQTEYGLTALPFFMKLSTLITDQSILTSKQKLTYDVLYDIAASVKDGESLFSQDVYQSLKTTGQYEFMDMFGETCSFDSDAGIAWLTFLQQMAGGEYIDESVSALYMLQFETQYYTVAPQFAVPSLEALEQVMGKKRLKFTEFQFNCVDAIGAALWCYSKGSINYCGYPSEDETVVLLSSDAVFSMSALSQNPDGTAAFLQYLLSTPIQTCRAVENFGIPVTRAALTEVFPVGYLHCSVGEPSSMLAEESWYAYHPDSFRLSLITRSQRMNEYETNLYSVFDFIRVTEDDRDLFLRFLDRAVARTAADATLLGIIDEEMSYVESGVRSPEEAGKILQSRVGIYLAE